MKKKDKFIFRCQSCGGQAPKWMGQCPECGQWDTLAEERQISGGGKQKKASFMPEPVPIGSVVVTESDRTKTGLAEFDRVLGGGIVDGSLILIGGDPGIGKSTLMLQVLSSLSGAGKKCLYVSGEESVRQISMRGQRLQSRGKDMYVVSETDLDTILALVGQTRYDALVIDSIQTVFHPDIASTPGSYRAPYLPGGPCHQGRGYCRSQDYGAYGGYGALL